MGIRLLGAITATVLLACSVVVAGGNPPDTGRYKLDGNGSCYWDENDSGADQCTPGRLKLDGQGQCYFEPNDSGADQCQGMSETAFYDALAFANQLINTYGDGEEDFQLETAADLEVAEGVWASGYAYGVIDEAGEELDDLIAVILNPPTGEQNQISCSQRNSIAAKANKLALKLAGAGATLLGAAVISAKFAQGQAAAVLTITGIGVGLLSGGAAMLGSVVGGMPCSG